MTPEERARQTVCDVFGAEKGWEHVTALIADDVRAAVLEEREKLRCPLCGFEPAAAGGDAGCRGLAEHLKGCGCFGELVREAVAEGVAKEIRARPAR